MGKIVLKDELVHELEAAAKAQGRSIDEQAEFWLRESLRRHFASRDLKARFAEVAAMSPSGAVQTDSVELLRELRDK